MVYGGDFAKSIFTKKTMIRFLEYCVFSFDQKLPFKIFNSFKFIFADRLTKFANEFWSPQTIKKHLEYSADVIEDIYKKDLNTASESNTRKVMMLEFSQYLENYLWLNFTENATKVKIFLDPVSELEKAPISNFSFAKVKKVKSKQMIGSQHNFTNLYPDFL